MKIFLTTLLLFLLGTTAYAQLPCYPEYVGMADSLTPPNPTPPLTTSMPYDEMTGYIALDSICRNVTSGEMQTFLMARTSWDDTAKIIAKYLTILTDRNPLLMHGLSAAQAASGYIMWPIELKRFFSKVVERHSPQAALDMGILTADYIAVVRIASTQDFTDTSAVMARTGRLASGSVLDTILGRTFPPCHSERMPANEETPPACIRFDVRRENIIAGRRSMLLGCDSSAIDAIMPRTGTYLVFLRIVPICRSTTKAYYSLGPCYWIGPQCGMFRIGPGDTLSDPTDYFQLGTSPALEAVIATIRQRKRQIVTCLSTTSTIPTCSWLAILPVAAK